MRITDTRTLELYKGAADLHHCSTAAQSPHHSTRCPAFHQKPLASICGPIYVLPIAAYPRPSRLPWRR